MANNLYNHLKFRYPFRLYQQQILDRLATDLNDNSRLHIVAPPGSGKTIVGLELIRRLDEKAVVFVPNTTIQIQWKKQLRLFVPDEEQYLVKELVSISPDNLKSINVFTYQLLSTPDQNNQMLHESGVKLWQQDLIQSRIALTKTQAEQRLRALKNKNSRSFADELNKYKKQAKIKLLSRDSTSVDSLLHPNAKALVDNLVAHGVKTVVLDEVHHLLDYWAITVNALALKIDNVHIIGLTATPPLSATTKQKETYLSLMGDIDYQVPTPAVIKEGNLAPHQDLVYFCQPTQKEKAFINDAQTHFETLIQQLSEQTLFKEFVSQTLTQAIESGWNQFFRAEPIFAISLIKYLILTETKIPKQVVVFLEMKKDITIDDWAILLTKYSLEYLKLSSDKQKHIALENIRAAFRRFGYVITETGIRNYRSPSDLILTYSGAKNDAVVSILRAEIQSLKESVRAVVITDFEKMSVNSTRQVRDVLDPEAGGAVGVFKSIVHDKTTTILEPILITGKSVLVDADELPVILNAMREWQRAHDYQFELEIKHTEYEKIFSIVGKGRDWKTSVSVRMVTDLFEKGVIKCLVSTRGLIGEGWNSLRINTLIDLTSATTSTTTNQVRGRALRLDPDWPTKIANIWYVVCLDTSFEKGDQDLKRLIKKHRHFYGINEQGKIIKGLNHLDEMLTSVLNHDGFKHIGIALINQRMMKRAIKRDEFYSKWKIGEPYENIELSGLSLNRKRIQFKTAFTLTHTAKGISMAAAQSVGGIGLWFIQNAYQVWRIPLFASINLGFQQMSIFFILISIQVHAGYKIRKLYNEVMTKIPVDAYVNDIALSVIKSLSDVGLIDQKFKPDDISVSSASDGRIHVEMTNLDSEKSRVINKALDDVFSPVTDQRYLISRTLNRLPLGLLSPFWWIGYSIFSLLKMTKPTYHPVPDLLAMNGKRARIFARNWQHYVGGGKLLYTRSNKGSERLLELRQYNYHDFEKMTYEIWK